MDLTWEQKLVAIKCISPSVHLAMREPGNWYVGGAGCNVVDGHVTASEYGNGKTPQLAVEDHWNKWTKLPKTKALIVSRYNQPDCFVRWNGFMWESIDDPRTIGSLITPKP